MRSVWAAGTHLERPGGPFQGHRAALREGPGGAAPPRQPVQLGGDGTAQEALREDCRAPPRAPPAQESRLASSLSGLCPDRRAKQRFHRGSTPGGLSSPSVQKGADHFDSFL